MNKNIQIEALQYLLSKIQAKTHKEGVELQQNAQVLVDLINQPQPTSKEVEEILKGLSSALINHYDEHHPVWTLFNTLQQTLTVSDEVLREHLQTFIDEYDNSGHHYLTRKDITNKVDEIINLFSNSPQPNLDTLKQEIIDELPNDKLAGTGDEQRLKWYYKARKYFELLEEGK